jgi:hypothetical protein
VVSSDGAVPTFAMVSAHVAGCPGWEVRTFEFHNVNGDTRPVVAGQGFTIVVP